MACGRTVTLPSAAANPFLCIRKTPFQLHHSSCFFPLQPSVGGLRLSRSCFKCSAVEYGDSSHHYNNNNNNSDSNQPAVGFAKPAEIPWKRELCNAVHLIGIVGAPVEIKHFPSSKVLAWTRLAVKKSPTETSWISLTFWDELAQVAFQHVEKGNQIYVSGRLVSDTVENDEGKSQTYYKVVVQQLNFIERNTPSTAMYDRDSSFTMPGRKATNGNAGMDKVSIEELWQAFFASPLEWWDNRKTKRNPKYPDFKHKDTGEALWVEGRYNPHWVKSQLAILDERMGSLHDQDDRSHVSPLAADDYVSY